MPSYTNTFLIQTTSKYANRNTHTHIHSDIVMHILPKSTQTNKHNRPTTAWSSERLKEFLSKSETIEQKEKKTTLDHMRIKKTQIVLSRKRTNKQEEGEQKKTKKKHKNHTHIQLYYYR